MSERDRLDRRLRAVERALTGDDRDIDTLAQSGDFARRLDEVEDRLHDIESRLDELDAATQAVRGYVGNIRSVNEDVAQRADAALAAVDRLEDRRDASKSAGQQATQRVADRPADATATADRTAHRTPRERRRDGASTTDQATGREMRAEGATHGASDVRGRDSACDGTDESTGQADATDHGVLDRIRARL